MNTVMFTHNDLDGIGCGILHIAAGGRREDTYFCSYQNVDEVISETIKTIQIECTELPRIIIADLGIQPETAEIIDKYEGEKILLDHHKTNFWLMDKYEWANIELGNSGTWQVFSKLDNVPFEYYEFAVHVDDYDLWTHNLPDSIRLNRLLTILGADRFIERFLENPDVKFTETERLLLELEEEKIERYVEKVSKSLEVYTLAFEKRLGVGFADRYVSEVAHELLDRHSLDAIALIDIHQKKISFRSQPDFDVGIIAKELGGGGHKNASGVNLHYGNITDFHGSKYPLLGVQRAIEETSFELFWRFNRVYERLQNSEIEKDFKKVKGGVVND